MMAAYAWAWIIVVVAAPLAVFSLHRATRGLPLGGFRHALYVLIAVLLVLPAPLPGYPGHYAPASLVFLFEAAFQSSGSPRAAALILGGGSILVLVTLLVWVGIQRRRRHRQVAARD